MRRSSVTMDIRLYQVSDAPGCLAVFASNVPAYFSAQERHGFETHLAALPCSYFVLEHDDCVAGCGGYFAAGPEAHLVWGMVHARYQKLGLGRLLLLYRLREIGRLGGVEQVSLGTSQHTEPFFVKQGFRTRRVIRDGWAPGLDRVEMTKKMAVCP